MSLNDNKSPPVSKTLLNILDEFNNAVVSMVPILPLISNSSSLFSKPLGTVRNAPTAIVISHLHVPQLFFSSLAKSKYLTISSFSIIFILWSAGIQNPLNGQFSFIPINTHHHNHHVVSPAQISPTLFRHSSLSFIASGRSSKLHPVSSQSYCMHVRAGRPAFVRPYEGGSIGVHHLWAHPCFSSSVLRVWSV